MRKPEGGTPQRILFGGTFDPPQLAHLRVLELAREALPEAEILVIPAGSPPHKELPGILPADLRLEMARLAFADLEGVRISDEECREEGPSYTWRTLERHRQELGPEAGLFLLLGSDSLLDLPGWRRPGRILALARVLTVPRPGFDPAGVRELPGLSREQKEALLEGILPGEAPDLSSSEIREALARGGRPGALLAPGVLSFIEARGLYGSRAP